MSNPSESKAPADPDQHLVVLFVLWMGYGLQEFLVSAGAAHVFRRARALAGHTERVRPAGYRIAARFDDDAMLPAVAEIVFVLELPDHVAEEGGEVLPLLGEHVEALGVLGIGVYVL